MGETDWLLGINPVLSALEHDPGNVEQVLVALRRDDRKVRQILVLCEQHRIASRRVERSELDQTLKGQRHQGVAASYRVRQPLDEADLLTHLGTLDAPLVLVLDHLEDPRNFGACLRSAAAAGVDAVVYPKDRAVGLTPVARRTAAGTAERLVLARVTNLNRTLEKLQKAGVWLVGADASADKSLYETDLTGPLALVLGGEGGGLKRLVRERCDFLASIPMHSQVESLNVSVAAAIMMFEARRQRLAP